MVRAKNKIAELIDHHVPIFADPAREYDYAACYRRYRRTRDGVRFYLVTKEGRELVLDIACVTADIFRVRAYPPGKEPPLTSPMLVEKKRAAPQVEVRAEPGKAVMATPSVELRVVRQPFHFGLFDTAGRRLFVHQIGDRSFLDLVAFPLGYSTDERGRVAFHEAFELEPDEHLFGLGQQYGSPDKRGQRIVSWSREVGGTNTTNLTYHNTPFFWSSRGYGVFLHHSSRAVYELGFPSIVTGAFRVDDPYLDYFLIYGPQPKQILARYGELTGLAPAPPLWSFGVWMSRCMYMDRKQVEEVVETARALGMPLDVIHVDPRWLRNRKHHQRDACDFEWDEEAFPDPEGFVRWLAERGVKLSLWENPYVWKDSEMYREGVEKGYFALAPDGSPAPSLENPPETENVVTDFTNPEAARWWQEKHRPYLRMGVALFKSDYGEGVPEDARFSDGRTGAQVHNIYPLLYNRAVFEVIREERGDEAMVWARSGYAGSQRYPVHWVGDTQCTWGGMAGALAGGLSLSMSGVPFWSHDIGGFTNPDRFRRPPVDLYIRWAQWGLLSSHSRFHGIQEREPWYYGERAVEIVREFARLRYRLLPYLWACAQEASRSLAPVVRPTYLEFPDDPLTASLQLQYMLGPWLLVAPVFNGEGRCRVYLPAGRWWDFWSGETIDGPRSLDLTVPLERIPIFVRQDSILPFAPEQEFVGQRPCDSLRLDVRLASRGALDVQMPEGRVRVRARRTRERVRLDLAASGQRLEIRLIEPKGLREVAFAGDAEKPRRRRTRNGTLIEMRLNGRAAVDARL
ncbi:MAG: glycoside hydrolase family 31 protein [Dehalococcoidia bacterium]|nr:glycoside hydrolase family 31 protein [Dehalococcoidia bacterium]